VNIFQGYISNYLNGKPVSPVILKTIDITLTVSLTSILFQKVYFHYDILDITDYKGIIRFFTSGQFIIPFTLFFLIHFSIKAISSAIFTIAAHFISVKWLNRILTYEFKLADVENFLNIPANQKLPVVPLVLDSSFIFKTYSHIKKSKTEKQWQKVTDKINRNAKSAKSILNLIIKAIIATIVYYNTIPYFGGFYFSFVLFLLIITLALQFIWHLILDIAPAAVRKFDVEMTKLLAESQNDDTINPQTEC
jgi:hypothetical protein